MKTVGVGVKVQALWLPYTVPMPCMCSASLEP